MALDSAIARYEAGDKAAAKHAAAAIAAASPEHAGALNLLAVIAQEESRNAEAEALARAALAREPESAIFLNTLGNALLNQGRSDEAIASFDQALRRLPEQADILFNLANAERAAGRWREAAAHYRRVLAARPQHIAAANNLALVLKAAGDLDGAIAALMDVIARAPRAAELRFNLGNAFQAASQWESAEAAFRAAISLKPDHAEAQANLGVVLAAAGQKDAARACFRQAIALNRDLVPAYVGLADLADDGSLDAVAHRRAALALNPDLAAVHSSLLMCVHYVPTPRAELFEEHKAFGARHDRPGPAAFSAAHDFAAGKRLRVGFVSGDFRFHAMRFFAASLLAAGASHNVDVVCYSTTQRPDAETARFRAAAREWRDVRELSREDLIALIVRDRIDVLVDMSGHAPHNRLLVFAARPAPLQVAWGDYVDTRGLAAIDLLFGDAIHTPPQDDGFYLERVVRFAPDYICYQPPEDPPAVAPAPAAVTGTFTFGTFSEATKIGAGAVALWATVLRALPQTRFLLNGHLFADGARRGRIISQFMDEHVAPERINFHTGGPHRDFLAQYALVDAILDTAPYSGGLTTCEALLMGVPLLTLAGDRFCGRHAAAHLMNGGYAEGVTASTEELIAKAKALVAEPGNASAARRDLRRRFLASTLCDAPRFAENFYRALRAAWRERCARQ